ncbi:MAG: hypothetical protein QM765_13605 [Myxococcales bacterium]
MTPEQITAKIVEWKLSGPFMNRITPLLRERMRTLTDFVAMADFFFTGDLALEPLKDQYVPKGRTAAQVADILQEYIERIDDPGEGQKRIEFKDKPLEEFSRAFCEKNGWKPKELFTALRVAVTGKAATPPLFACLEVVGREMCRKRIRASVDYLRTLK